MFSGQPGTEGYIQDSCWIPVNRPPQANLWLLQWGHMQIHKHQTYLLC